MRNTKATKKKIIFSFEKNLKKERNEKQAKGCQF